MANDLLFKGIAQEHSGQFFGSFAFIVVLSIPRVEVLDKVAIRVHHDYPCMMYGIRLGLGHNL